MRSLQYDAEKAFDKMQHPFMINALPLGVERGVCREEGWRLGRHPQRRLLTELLTLREDSLTLAGGTEAFFLPILKQNPTLS